ncbi:LmeA family phospholipid-binding protein [Amycolatopsis sp. NPDC059657]|uniref:LmeA family phospholipid-binding protein n=1 Tax=Amycolatopsis sp. NPDC059657 TaxID=3346899 RepID=UPI00366A5CA2
MSDANWFDGLVPWNELAGLAAVGRSLLPQVPTSPASALRMASERLLGRRISTKVGDNDVDLTLTALDYQADSLRLATGRLGDVRIVAEDITWPDTPVKRLTVIAGDVRFRSLPTPTVKPASVEIHILVESHVLRERVAELKPGVQAEPGDDGLLEIRWAKHPRWGYAELEPTVGEEAILLRPRALHVFGLTFHKLPRRFKPITLPLPDLPPGIRLAGIETRNGDLMLHTVADQWPERLSKIPLPELVGWMTTAALTLTLPRLTPKSR